MCQRSCKGMDFGLIERSYVCIDRVRIEWLVELGEARGASKRPTAQNFGLEGS